MKNTDVICVYEFKFNITVTNVFPAVSSLFKRTMAVTLNLCQLQHPSMAIHFQTEKNRCNSHRVTKIWIHGFLFFTCSKGCQISLDNCILVQKSFAWLGLKRTNSIIFVRETSQSISVSFMSSFIGLKTWDFILSYFYFWLVFIGPLVEVTHLNLFVLHLHLSTSLLAFKSVHSI